MAISERQMNTTPVMSLVIYVYFEILFTLLAGIQELKLSGQPNHLTKYSFCLLRMRDLITLSTL